MRLSFRASDPMLGHWGREASPGFGAGMGHCHLCLPVLRKYSSEDGTSWFRISRRASVQSRLWEKHRRATTMQRCRPGLEEPERSHLREGESPALRLREDVNCQ